MSYSFRERLRMALKADAREKLGLSKADVETLWDNIRSICPISDEILEIMKKHDPYLKGKDIDEIVEKLSDEEFLDLVREVLKRGFKKIGYKQKKDEVEKEAEEESDSDSDSDSDGSEEPIEEAEAEVECEK